MLWAHFKKRSQTFSVEYWKGSVDMKGLFSLPFVGFKVCQILQSQVGGGSRYSWVCETAFLLFFKNAPKSKRYFYLFDLMLKVIWKILCLYSLKWIYSQESCMSPSLEETGLREVCLRFHEKSPVCIRIGWHGRIFFFFFFKCFLFAGIWVEFFFFFDSFLMVFSEGSKWHWSVKADSKIYNVFVLADCQQNRPFPVVLYTDSENQ